VASASTDGTLRYKPGHRSARTLGKHCELTLLPPTPTPTAFRIWSLESQQGAGADDTKNATIFCFTEILSLAWETKSDRLVQSPPQLAAGVVSLLASSCRVIVATSPLTHACFGQLFCGTADGRVKLWNPNNVAIGEISTDVDYPRYCFQTISPSSIDYR
jgi:hypothetical protein